MSEVVKEIAVIDKENKESSPLYRDQPTSILNSTPQ
jgi:hypothetical protein